MDRIKVTTKYQKNLELRNLIIEKLLLGAALVGLGVFLNFRIEAFRSELHSSEMRDEFLLSERYEAISKMQSLIADLRYEIRLMVVDCADSLKDSLPLHDERYYRLFSQFDSEIKHSKVLFAGDFLGRIEKVRMCYLDLVELKPMEWAKFEDFLRYVEKVTHELMRHELGFTLTDTNLLSYEFVATEKFDVNRPGKYLSENLSIWKQADKSGQSR